MMNNQLKEYEDHWVLPLQNRELTRCCVDYGFVLEFWEQESNVTIRIGESFLVKVNQEEHELCAEKQSLLGPALSLLHETVESAIASKRGALILRFSNGNSLLVEASNNYEAWELHGPGGLHVISTPDGNLSIWQAQF